MITTLQALLPSRYVGRHRLGFGPEGHEGLEAESLAHPGSGSLEPDWDDIDGDETDGDDIDGGVDDKAYDEASGSADPAPADLPTRHRWLRLWRRPRVLEQEQSDVVIELAADPLDERALQ